jgi:NAD(P)-dependent dehydrogenase (short-subunit alcohol dehydrogenase family)
MESKVALVTGGNKGIGLAVAQGLGAKGVIVFVGARDRARGEAAAVALRDQRVDARFVQLDVTDAASIEAARAEIAKTTDHLDILVNNAGIAVPSYEEVYATNVFGVERVTRAMLPLLRAAPKGRIVNVSSTMGSLGGLATRGSETASWATKVPAYASSKAALNALTLIFAEELASTPIVVSSACPGFCATDINGHAGPRSTEQGASVIVELALSSTESGAFFNEAGRVAW